MSDDSLVTIKTEELQWFLMAVEEISLPHATLVDIGVGYLKKHSWIELLPEDQRGAFLEESRATIAQSADPLHEAERIEEEKLSSLFEESGAADRRGSSRRVRDRRRKESPHSKTPG